MVSIRMEGQTSKESDCRSCQRPRTAISDRQLSEVGSESRPKSGFSGEGEARHDYLQCRKQPMTEQTSPAAVGSFIGEGEGQGVREKMSRRNAVDWTTAEATKPQNREAAFHFQASRREIVPPVG